MPRFLRRFITRLRGNPKALAAFLVFFGVMFGTLAVMYMRPSGFDVIAGALLGVGASMAATSIVSFLEAPDDRNIPYQFIEAAKREVHLIRYYREDQEVHIDFVETESKQQRIRLGFYSRLVPILPDEIALDYPKILPPAGLRQMSTTYKVGGEIVSPDSQKILQGPADESIEVQYEVIDKEKIEYSDDHVWLSPVLKYDIYFSTPPNFNCAALERISDKYFQISPRGRRGAGQIHCSQTHSAFSRQGFRWKILRNGVVVE